MAKSTAEDKRLTRLTKIARGLPEAKRELHSSHATFLIRKRPFAYFLNNHHGDGIIGFTCKVLPGENNSLIAAHPDRFYSPAYLASRGWVALRLDRGAIDWDEVKELLLGSYVLIAPKRLAEQVISDIES